MFALAVAVAGLAFAVRAFSPSKDSEHQSSLVTIPGEGSIFFPTQKAPANGYPAALMQGKLEDRSGCIVVGHGQYATLPIWPNGYRLTRSATGKLLVVGGDGKVVARIGQVVGMGGGLVGESRNAVGFAQQLIGGSIPQRCRADGYWVASGVSTNPRFTH